MHLLQIVENFKTQEDCIKFLEQKRWKGKPQCPYCQSTYTNPLTSELRHHCNGCRKSFSVTVGTIFHQTHLPLKKWLIAIALVSDAKKGISSRQLSRHLNLPVKTGYSLGMRIRSGMKDKDANKFAGVVEMDETYVKTHDINSNEDDDNNLSGGLKRGRGSQNNTAVIGIKEKNGSVKAKVVDNVKFDTLFQFAKANVAEGIEFHTDEFRSYTKFKSFFNHKVVNHSKEYVTANKIHTNGLEGFWSLLKRGINGQFHHVTRGYLQAYVNEFCFRYNLRELSQNGMFNVMVERMLGV